jgi:hypothetical protein
MILMGDWVAIKLSIKSENEDVKSEAGEVVYDQKRCHDEGGSPDILNSVLVGYDILFFIFR